MDKFIQIQKNLLDYFKDVDDATFIEFVDCFAYDASTDNEEVSKLAEQFIEDQGLFDAIINHKYDQSDKATIFNRSSLSQVTILQDVKTALVSLSHNRFRKSILNSKIDALDIKIGKQENKMSNIILEGNLKSFNLLKSELLECYSSLNNNENYFYGKEADAKIVKRITKIEYLS